MKLNADFSKRAVMHANQIDWQPSPMSGVSRRMLDRIGDEVARATSIVRYDANSHFSPHVHDGGEEFIVLEGVFQDEHGDFPAGSYIRNPPQSSHTPGSDEGCVIFVKLWQFDLADRKHVRLRFDEMAAAADPVRSDVSVISLHEDEREKVSIEIWEPGASLQLEAEGGAEILVLEGGFQEQGEQFGQYSWLRSPVNSTLNITAGPEGARIWLKTGHLRFIQTPQLD